ncbi:hypothetical protein ABZT27_18880 [Streptomyces sp. NPDC005389]|uniref:hypothetical protein n=1 Tax=Streptomyces sp. NPDC005389 TaxID=3157040 RepID=UPI0033B67B92
MPTDPFRRKTTVDHPSVLPAPSLSSALPEGRRRTGYRATVESVSPSAHRDTADQHEACFLGVSLDNSGFSPARFDAMLT